MFKVTPNPPDADSSSPFETSDPRRPDGTSARIPSYADIRATPRTLCTM